MASSMSPATLWSSKSLASDNLLSSNNGVILKELGRTPQLLWDNTKRRTAMKVIAKLRKGKRHEYPWPKDPDPNVKGGVLTHLSYFKPLKDKQKPVTLDFEKPLMDLKNKIMDVMKLANETGLDFSDKIASLEYKYEQALKELYLHLTPIQRVGIARHPNRPTFLDHVFNITDKFVELHGDRAGYDDPAIVTGLGVINGKRYMFIGHQKGRNTKENIQRNFGMPTPHGYRKALRMMYYADHHGFPIVTFIDTPGAYADMKSEELGQGEAIAHNLRSMFGLRVPIVSIVIGEGGSGGALAIGCANKLLMLENAVFYVASPEACAAILYKTAKAAPKAAERLKITAPELCNLQIADGIIPEPLGGAHADPSWTSQQIKKAIEESMDELLKMDADTILQHRNQKFRKIGVFIEGLPVDPKKKINMKKKDEPVQSRAFTLKLESEVEKLKEQILKSKDSSAETPNVDEMIGKLKQEVDLELSVAAQALGLQDHLLKLREELTKARNSKDELMHPVVLDKVERFKQSLSQRLSAAPNYPALSVKLNMLKELSQAKKKSELYTKSTKLKHKVNELYKEVLDHPDIKKKVEMLKFEIERSGSSKFSDLDDGLKTRIMEVKGEVENAFAVALRSLDLDLKLAKSNNTLYSVEETLPPNVKSMIGELDEEIQRRIDDIVNSSDLKNKLNLLKLEATKAGKNAEESNIQFLIKDIKDSLAEALKSSELAEKHGRLLVEIEKGLESDGSSSKSENSGSKVEERSYA